MPAYSLDTGALSSRAAFSGTFNFVDQESAGNEPVEALLACGLALDLKPSGFMQQHDARGGLVDVLAAMSARTDESLFDVRIADAQSRHPLRELRFAIGTD